MLALLNGLFLGLWRRLYGEGKVKGLLGNRTFQAIIFVLIQTLFWLSWENPNWTTFGTTFGTTLWITLGITLGTTIGIAIWVYAMYWSRAIGCVLDCGAAWWQTHKDYNRWWTKIVNWIAHKLGLHKYYGMYDFIWMIFRYTLCLLPLIYWGHQIWLAGLLSAPIYYWCKYLFENNPGMYKVFDDSKDLAEIIFGFTSGCIFYIMW